MLTSAAAVLVCAQAAQAADFNVSTAAAFKTALAAAAATADPDRIVLAPGAYDGGVNGFDYGGPSRIEIVGAPRLQTILTSSSDATLRVTGVATPAHRVASLWINVPTGTGSRHGLDVESAAVESVTVVVIDPVATNNGSGIVVDGVSTITRATVVGATARGIWVNGGAGTTIEDTTIKGPGSDGTGIDVGGVGGSATVRRSRVSEHYTGVAASFGGSLTVLDSIVRVADGQGLRVGDNDNGSGFVSSVTAERVTIVGAGLSGSRGVRVEASSAGDAMTATLRDTVIANVPIPTACYETGGGAGAISTQNSNLTLTGQDDDCGGGINHAERTEHEPGFVDVAGGDFRLRFDSPLVDIGRPGPAPPAGTLDAGGLARPADGNGDGVARVDIGAYEYQRRPPKIASATASPPTAGVGQIVSFKASASELDPLESVSTYVWTFDDGAQATGASVDHAFTTQGSHTATLTVTDSVGASSQ